MKLLYTALLLAITIASCAKRESNKPDQEVELYLAESFQRVSGKCQVDESTLVLKDQPLVANDAILSYSRATRVFHFSDAGTTALANAQPGQAFAITVNKVIIYSGIILSPAISASCENSIVLLQDPDHPADIHVDLGYPAFMNFTGIPDKRNDFVLLEALAAQGKLI